MIEKFCALSKMSCKWVENHSCCWSKTEAFSTQDCYRKVAWVSAWKKFPNLQESFIYCLFSPKYPRFTSQLSFIFYWKPIKYNMSSASSLRSNNILGMCVKITVPMLRMKRNESQIRSMSQSKLIFSKCCYAISVITHYNKNLRFEPRLSR